MLGKVCPCCGRWLRAATVTSVGLVAFHVVVEPYELAHGSASTPYVRQEHVPETEPATGPAIPGFYRVAALTTTTTTTAAPSGTIALSPLIPAPGKVVAWSDAAQSWVEIPDCGFRG